jgi:hypothetical protein
LLVNHWPASPNEPVTNAAKAADNASGAHQGCDGLVISPSGGWRGLVIGFS